MSDLIARLEVSAEGRMDGRIADLLGEAAAALRQKEAELRGPSGYDTWKDAAIDERMRRVAAEKNLAAAEAQISALRDQQPVAQPWKMSCWYMYDNHTFLRLTGSPTEMVEQARAACASINDSGMLCPVRWVVEGNPREMRETGVAAVHARAGVMPEEELKRWAQQVSNLKPPTK